MVFVIIPKFDQGGAIARKTMKYEAQSRDVRIVAKKIVNDAICNRFRFTELLHNEQKETNVKDTHDAKGVSKTTQSPLKH